MNATIVLFRPVGPRELELIAESGWTAFPPRLPEQPIFYPVVNEDYARQIARDWNVKESGQGFVVRFRLPKGFLDPFDVQQVGGRQHLEYWIPAERLADLNAAILGPIELIAEYPPAAGE
jgi:hypothetical protein